MSGPVSLSQASDALSDIVDVFSSDSVDSGDAPQGNLLEAITAGINSAAATPPPRFEGSDLYGPDGRPRAADIDQDSIGDCYFTATIGAIAERQPSRIQSAISYDATTGTFMVRMYKPEWSWSMWSVEPKEVQIPVTQQDILDNIGRNGASTVDNIPGTDGPIWPAVMETAYAKLNDSDWSNGLDQGYNQINGGYPRDAMYAVTGSKGWDLSGLDILDPKYQAEVLYSQVSAAIREGQPVTIATRIEDRTLFDILNSSPGKQDGLVDNHAYMCERIYKNANGDVMVELRNPWNRNLNVGEGMDTPNAKITVKLETLLETNGLQYFNIGPRK